MALSKSQLKDRIITELDGQGFATSVNGRDNGNWIHKFAQAISNAVIDEIQENARVIGEDSGTWGGDSHNLPVV